MTVSRMLQAVLVLLELGVTASMLSEHAVIIPVRGAIPAETS